MYVCHCHGVNDRTIRGAIAQGARTIEDIARICGAGSQCQGCWPALMDLLEATVDRRELAMAGTLGRYV